MNNNINSIDNINNSNLKGFTTPAGSRPLGLALVALVTSAFSQLASADVTYVHTDHLGSPAVYTNGDGQVIGREFTMPYGETVEAPITNDTVSYTGHVRDGDTGLVYMQARYYDPEIGRFLSVDPVTFSDENQAHFNRYWYANGNPARYTDPDGRCPNCIVGVAAFVADVVVQVAIEGRSLSNVNYVRSGLVGVTAAGGGLVTGLYAAGATGAAATAINAGGAALTGMAAVSAASSAEGGNISDGMNVKTAISSVLGGKLASGPAGELATEIEGNLISTAIEGAMDQADSLASGLTGPQTDITKALNEGDFEMQRIEE